MDRKVGKGNSMTGFMQRNLWVSNKDVKATAYFILIQPNVVYCASMSSPYTDQGKRKVKTQGSTLIFSSYVDSGPASTAHPPPPPPPPKKKKINTNFTHPKKIFENLATQKNTRLLYLDLKKRP